MKNLILHFLFFPILCFAQNNYRTQPLETPFVAIIDSNDHWGVFDSSKMKIVVEPKYDLVFRNTSINYFENDLFCAMLGPSFDFYNYKFEKVDKINNSFYKFGNKNYYNVGKSKTSFDEVINENFAKIGDEIYFVFCEYDTIKNKLFLNLNFKYKNAKVLNEFEIQVKDSILNFNESFESFNLKVMYKARKSKNIFTCGFKTFETDSIENLTEFPIQCVSHYNNKPYNHHNEPIIYFKNLNNKYYFKNESFTSDTFDTVIFYNGYEKLIKNSKSYFHSTMFKNNLNIYRLDFDSIIPIKPLIIEEYFKNKCSPDFIVAKDNKFKIIGIKISDEFLVEKSQEFTKYEFLEIDQRNYENYIKELEKNKFGNKFYRYEYTFNLKYYPNKELINNYQYILLDNKYIYPINKFSYNSCFPETSTKPIKLSEYPIQIKNRLFDVIVYNDSVSNKLFFDNKIFEIEGSDSIFLINDYCFNLYHKKWSIYKIRHGFIVNDVDELNVNFYKKNGKYILFNESMGFEYDSIITIKYKNDVNYSYFNEVFITRNDGFYNISNKNYKLIPDFKIFNNFSIYRTGTEKYSHYKEGFLLSFKNDKNENYIYSSTNLENPIKCKYDSVYNLNPFVYIKNNEYIIENSDSIQSNITYVTYSDTMINAIILNKLGLFGIWDYKNKSWIIEPIMEEIRDVYHYTVIVKHKGKIKLYNWQTKEFFPFKFDYYEAQPHHWSQNQIQYKFTINEYVFTCEIKNNFVLFNIIQLIP